MRKRLLGTIAAVAAGAGAALAQSPPPPAPIGPAGGFGGGVTPAAGFGGPVDPIPPPVGVGGGYGPMPGGPGLFPPGGMGGPMGGPMAGPGGPMDGPMPYPPPGLYGQQQWQPPFTGRSAGTNSRFAPRLWGELDYLLWFAKAQPANFLPFVTTGPPASGGVLGGTGTTVLYPTTDLGYGLFSGFRVTVGGFCDDCRRCGFYGSGFLLEQKANTFDAQSDQTGQPLLARPFINVFTGLPDAQLVSFPTFASGFIGTHARNRTYGAEGGGLVNLYRSCPDDCGPGGWLWDVNFLAGFRFLSIHEVLTIESFTNLLPGNTLTYDGKLYGFPAAVQVVDQFDTLNEFYGGQVGLNTAATCGRWSFSLAGKVAIGLMHQRVDINGYSTLYQPDTGPLGADTASRTAGGLYANANNIGRYRNDEFAVVPEFIGKVGYNWCSWFSTNIGYTFLYASRVVRPADQYTPVVNPSVIPTSPAYGLGPANGTPNPVLTQTDFWVQGITFGAVIKY